MTKLVGKISDGVFINMATPAKVKEIAARVREGAIEAGRDPSKIEIIAKSRVSLNPDKNAARAKLRQVLTFYNIADHYSDMLRGMGFEKEVNAIHEAFQKGGFKAAMGALTDDYMDKLPVVPASDIERNQRKDESLRRSRRDAHGDSLRAGDRAGGRRCAEVLRGVGARVARLRVRSRFNGSRFKVRAKNR